MDPVEIGNLSKAAVELAERWQERAESLKSRRERAFQSQIAGLLKHPIDKVTLTRLIDQSFRSGNRLRVADQIITLLEENNIPEFFSSWEKLLVKLFIKFGRTFPGLTVPQVIRKMRQFSNQVIIPGEKRKLHAHLKKRKRVGVRINLNHLGEAVLGEDEAKTRLETYSNDLQRPEIEYISVKISTIYSQIQPLAFRHTVEILKDRLAHLYRTASNNFHMRKGGKQVPKFVNLDMEEHRDQEITTTAFMETLDQAEFKQHKAGIVLQAYIPESYRVQRMLTEWALERINDGGAPIKIRIVKGANLQMEQVESAIYNWPLPTFDNKTEVDANYKRMMLYGMEPKNIAAVNLGIASHNVFELAFAYQVAENLGVLPYVDFEMLEGMADHIRQAVMEDTKEVLLYTPAAETEQFINAIAYLIRRLDENTAPENFLRYAPHLKTGSIEWEFQKNLFFKAIQKINAVKDTPNRTQNRQTETKSKEIGTYYQNEFDNEPDTDWSLAKNREWADGIRHKWMKSASEIPIEIPLVIGGEDIHEDRDTVVSSDQSRYHDNIWISRFRLGNSTDVEKAVATAKADPDSWRSMTHDHRHKTLSRVADELRQARGDLIGAAAVDTGKVFTEADVEVSEAIDFTEYYPFSVKQFVESGSIEGRGKGVGLVVSPWNFPIAIPCGGIVASLAAGNTVIFKPSSDSVTVAWELCQCFWRAGVPKTALQFLPCSGASEGAKLVAHPDVDFVILTGGTETGMRMLKSRPNLFLAAETGGKNATIVTAISDRDQAISNVVVSAFGNGGQKCSATSLLILEKEVYEDENFKKQLVDATKSFSTGSAWEFQHRMGPLIKPPAGDLKRALTTLEPGESWALKPEMVDNNPYIWTPGIKWDVTPGSLTHMTEFFGPVLAVICADDLEQAIEITNQTGYGLTSGIESLDSREIYIWKEKIEAGNLYINRGTTGAVTLRQPFGGIKKSAIGAGIKAGSPNYVTQFMIFEDRDLPKAGALEKENRLVRLTAEWDRKTRWNHFGLINGDMSKVVRAMKSYLFHYQNEFSKEIDYFHLRGQDNILRYLPLGKIIVRIHEKDTLFETLARIFAVRVTENELFVSLPTALDNELVEFLSKNEGRRLLKETSLVFENDEELKARITDVARIRYARHDRVPNALFEAAAETGFYISCTPVLMEGRIELLQYLQNQSICHTYHRYGNLGTRGMST